MFPDALLNIVETEPIERETSAFDEYDRENGYEDEEQEEQNTWKICGEIVDRVTKIAIRLMPGIIRAVHERKYH